MGDPCGVGPEIVVRAWARPELHAVCRPLAIGRPAVFRRAAEQCGLALQVAETPQADGRSALAGSSPTRMHCLTVGTAAAEDAAPGKVDSRGGQAAYDALIAAARLALDDKVDGLVTAPLNKASLAAAGHDYPGHTELLADLCGVDDVAMMLYLPPSPQLPGPAGLGVVHATLHAPLREVFTQLTEQRILATIHRAHEAFVGLLPSQPPCPALPRIGVCALNPHAGEDGLFGDEEIRLIAPAVAQAQAAGILASGPFPADTLLSRARHGEFDAVVAMYHDQGHIALKMLGMHSAVNVTLGLPIVRTSVAHGTAFDLVGTGRAEIGGMLAAARVAAQLANDRSRSIVSRC